MGRTGHLHIFKVFSAVSAKLKKIQWEILNIPITLFREQLVLYSGIFQLQKVLGLILGNIRCLALTCIFVMQYNLCVYLQ